MVGTLSDYLAAPQLAADLSVGVAHGGHRQEVRHDRNDNVVSEQTTVRTLQHFDH